MKTNETPRLRRAAGGEAVVVADSEGTLRYQYIDGTLDPNSFVEERSPVVVLAAGLALADLTPPGYNKPELPETATAERLDNVA